MTPRDPADRVRADRGLLGPRRAGADRVQTHRRRHGRPRVPSEEGQRAAGVAVCARVAATHEGKPRRDGRRRRRGVTGHAVGGGVVR